MAFALPFPVAHLLTMGVSLHLAMLSSTCYGQMWDRLNMPTKLGAYGINKVVSNFLTN